MKPTVLVTEQVAIPDWAKNHITIEYAPDLWEQPEHIQKKLSEFDALIVRNRTFVTADLIAHGKKLKAIGRLGTGLDNIDVEAAKKRGIAVISTPDANTDAVAEYCLGQMLFALRKLDHANRATKDGKWDRLGCIGKELKETTVGIVGYGHIGKRLHELLKAFGCNILITSRHLPASENIVPLEELFARADIISLHIEGGSANKGIISADLLKRMKKDVVFINTARGDVVDEAALEAVARANPEATFILDVRQDEPPKDKRFLDMPNMMLSPHIAAFTTHARKTVAEVVFYGVISVVCARDNLKVIGD